MASEHGVPVTTGWSSAFPPLAYVRWTARRWFAPQAGAPGAGAILDGTDRSAWLGVLINRVTAFAILANAALVVGNQKVLTPWLPRELMILVLVATAAAAVPILIAAVRGQPDPQAGYAFIATTLAANVLVALAPKSTVLPLGTPLVNTTTVIAAGLAAVVFRSRMTSTVALAALGVSYAAVRAPVTGWKFGLLESAITLLGCVILGILTRSLYSTYGAAAKVEGDRVATSSRNVALLARQRVRDEWDRLLHDKVLGALLLASRSTSFATLSVSRALAGDALRALGVLDGGATSRSLGALAERRGLTLRGNAELSADLPDDVANALTAALDEVLSNVARHSGVTEVTVSVRGGAHGVVVVVRDEGVGFDPSVVSDRFGLAQSIPGHLGAIGGDFRVDSAVGEGTSVTLRWVPVASAEVAPRSLNAVAWRLGDQPERSVVVVGWVCLHLLVGYLATTQAGGWPAAEWPLAITLAMSVVAGSVVTGHAGWLWMAVTAVCLGLLVALVQVPAGIDWTYWFVGITLPLPIVRVMDRANRQAWMICAVISFALVVGMLPHGWKDLWIIREAIGSAWLFTTIAVMGMHALDCALDRLRAAANALLRQREIEGRLTHRAELDQERRRQLSRDVIPVLWDIYSASVVSESNRRHAALVEAGARDRLTGPALLDAAVAEAARVARVRGARVVLRSERDVDDVPAQAAFRRALVCLLKVCGDGSRLTASWHPSDDERIGTLAVTNPTGQVDSSCLGVGQECRVEQDADEIWVEFLAQTAGHPRS